MKIHRNESMNSNQRLEVEGRAFEIMTGRMAPFKDLPAAAGPMDIAEQNECLHEWRNHHRLIISAMEAAFEEVMGP